MSSPSGPVSQSIRTKLTQQFNPTELKITNDSWQHRHHTAMRESGGGNGETHFSVQIVSESFAGKASPPRSSPSHPKSHIHAPPDSNSNNREQSTMQRHRLIYGALSEELAQGLHALSLHTKTPSEATAAADRE